MVFEAECFRLRSIVSFDERDVIMTKNKWFGTDGVRGVANEFPMTAEFAFRLGCAAAEIVCTDKKKVAIAKDTRISADMLEASLCAAFTAKGIDVIRLGVIPTPTVTAFADTLGVDMALMITASHNPYYDNGIKLIAPNGDKFSDETTAELETLIEKNDFSFDKNKIGKITENFSIVEKYMQQAINLFGNVKLNGMKIVVDCANGCFSNILPEVLRQAGAEVVAIGVSPDGYNINKDCGSQHVEAMLEEVKNQRADLGIAVDGDGDRIKVCNEKGVLIKSDQLIAFLAKYLQQSGENRSRPIVSTKLSNTGLERYIKNILGLEYYVSAVGERHVIKLLKEKGVVIGGEESGHIVLLDYVKSGDAMMTALMLIKGLVALGQKSSEIFPLFKEDFLYFENFAVKNMAQVKEITSDAGLAKILDCTSQEMIGHGRVVIHPSGTEPKIRVWVCGDDENLVKSCGQKLWNKIEDLAKSA